MAATSSYTISKSSFIAGSQCTKLLWTKFHDRDAFPEVDEAKQAIFNQGHEIGDMAKLLYPGGIEVAEGIYGYAESIAETDKVISRRVPLYEPAFEHNSGFVRVDILNPTGEDSWEIIEVKSGTRVRIRTWLISLYRNMSVRERGSKSRHVISCTLIPIT